VADSSLAPYVITGIFTLVAGVGGSLGGVALAQKLQADRDATTQRFQRERDEKADERAIRDRKADRLRRAYQELMILALEMSVRAWRWRWLPAEIQKLPDEERVARMEQLIEEAALDRGRGNIAVLLESDPHAGEVLDIFFRIEESFREQFFNIAHQAQQQTEEGGRAAKEFAEQIQKEVNRLGDTVRTHLAELEKPI
jgi:hypothetical protein